jgi:hypothetical protein
LSPNKFKALFEKLLNSCKNKELSLYSRLFKYNNFPQKKWIFSRKWLKKSPKTFAEIDVNGEMNKSSSSKVRKMIFFDSTPTTQPI